MMDRKFTINATALKSGKTYTEENAILFLAKDRALPAALEAYLEACVRLGAEEPQIKAVQLLIERVDRFHRENPTKVPDVDPIAEAGALIA